MAEEEPSVASRARELTEKIISVGVAGAGPWKGSIEIAEEHLDRHKDVEKAIDRLVRTHVRLTSGTGFLTGVGGLITLPVAVPTDLATLWIAQGRMAGSIAHLRGYDLESDEVASIVLLSLLGAAGAEALSSAGIQIGTKSALAAVNKIPGKVLIEINKKVGFRLLTKAGVTGVVNLGKLVPLAGGVVGGTVNGVSTHVAGTWARRNFTAA